MIHPEVTGPLGALRSTAPSLPATSQPCDSVATAAAESGETKATILGTLAVLVAAVLILERLGVI